MPPEEEAHRRAPQAGGVADVRHPSSSAGAVHPARHGPPASRHDRHDAERRRRARQQQHHREAGPPVTDRGEARARVCQEVASTSGTSRTTLSSDNKLVVHGRPAVAPPRHGSPPAATAAEDVAAPLEPDENNKELARAGLEAFRRMTPEQRRQKVNEYLAMKKMHERTAAAEQKPFIVRLPADKVAMALEGIKNKIPPPSREGRKRFFSDMDDRDPPALI